MERSLSEIKKQLMGMVDAITDFIFLTDGEGRIIRTNLAFANFFGKHPRELIGRRLTEFIDMDLPLSQGSEKETELPLTMEKTIRDERYLISSFPLYENGKLLTVHVLKNITTLERFREQLFYSDKLASLGLLVSGVAHEINNPLTGIIAYTQLLRMKDLDEKVDRELKKILDSAERCKKIIENLLTFARQRTPTKSLESINGIIDRTIDLRSYSLRSSNIEVIKDYGEVRTIFVDSQQVQQAILNILLNAEQAVVESQRGGGRITFTTRYDGDRRRVIVRISDDGRGIPKEQIVKIFDPFFTTKPVGIGTGLGLSAAYGIITEHGGSINVESSVGLGSTFAIEIPLGWDAGMDLVGLPKEESRAAEGGD